MPHEPEGKDEDKYWKWVKEVKPVLPHGFVKNFTKRSRAVIRRKSKGKADVVPGGDDDEDDEVGRKTAVCVIS